MRSLTALELLGPAGAGALAPAYYAQRLGLDRLMSLDMGGTTAKACLVEDRTPRVWGNFQVDRQSRSCEDIALPLPSIDMIEIGAGGASIAWVDQLGFLKVGPRSAGPQPGPACYGAGGLEATVTDADLVLGLLDTEAFPGGDMQLDRAAAMRCMSRLGETLGSDISQTAASIYRIVVETVAAAARAHANDRGVEHRGLPMLAFGGAGTVHACAVGELLQSTQVIFPPLAQGADTASNVALRTQQAAAPPRGWRSVTLWPQSPPTPVFHRPDLSPAQRITGPALIDERETTIVLPPGWFGEVDHLGCVVARRQAR